MGQFIMGNLGVKRNMGTGFSYLKIKLCMMDIGRMISFMDQEIMINQMEIVTKGNGLMVNKMDLVCLILATVINMKGSGQME